jgi:hypothetical protein
MFWLWLKNTSEPARYRKIVHPTFCNQSQNGSPYFWTCGPWAIMGHKMGHLGPKAWAWGSHMNAHKGADNWWDLQKRLQVLTMVPCCQTPAPKVESQKPISTLAGWLHSDIAWRYCANLATKGPTHWSCQSFYSISYIVVSCFDPIPGVIKGWDVAMYVTRFE